MTNEELAVGLFRQAESSFNTMKEAFRADGYPYTVRVAQEWVELSLKAVLISAGIDPPKWHDVGTILLEHADRFPSADKAVLEEMAFISRSLRGNGKRACTGTRSCACPRTAFIQGMMLKQLKNGLKRFTPSGSQRFKSGPAEILWPDRQTFKSSQHSTTPVLDYILISPPIENDQSPIVK